MEARTLRAVPVSGGFRVVAQPPDARVDEAATYGRADVEELAAELQLELRWVEPPRGTRRRDPGAEGGDDVANTDPWGGDLPPGPEP